MVDPKDLARIVREFTGRDLSEQDLYDYGYFLKGAEDVFDAEKRERIRSELASIVMHNPGLARSVAEECKLCSKEGADLVVEQAAQEKNKIGQPKIGLLRKIGMPLAGLAAVGALFLSGYFLCNDLKSKNPFDKYLYAVNSGVKKFELPPDNVLLTKDTVLPVGEYFFYPGRCIQADGCKLTVQPGTVFRFADRSGIKIEGGILHAVGDEKNKISFLPAQGNVSASIIIESSFGSRLEHCVIKQLEGDATRCGRAHYGMKMSSADSRLIVLRPELNNYAGAPGPLVLLSSEVNMDTLELIQNKGGMGGGCYAENCKLEFVRCSFVRNEADFGGGIHLTNCQSSFYDCVLDQNIAKAGGGVSTSGIKTVAVFNNSRITKNRGNIGSYSYAGGAFFNAGSHRIDNCQFIGNIADECGAILTVSDLPVYLDGKCVIQGNSEPQLSAADKSGKFEYDPSIVKDKK